MVPGMAVGAARWGVDGAALGYLVGAVLATAALATAIDWSEDR
jgi:hypothetical protein